MADLVYKVAFDCLRVLFWCETITIKQAQHRYGPSLSRLITIGLGMLKNVIASLVFTIAALALINFVGDVVMQKTTPPPPEMSAQMPGATPEAVEPAPTPEPVPAPEPIPEPQPEPVAVAPATVAPTLTDGNIKAGKKTFRRKCMSCHTIDKGGKDRTGPNLWGIVGRNRAASETFRYSNTMKMLGGTWSETDIGSFIAGPRTFLPDTKMTFAGLKDATDRANVLAYLKTLTD